MQELRWYQERMRREVLSDPESKDEADVAEEAERWVRCAECAAAIAKEEARIAINGAHVHDFMNPAGHRFRVACFSAAPGCAPEGDKSTVWTWFPGYAWQIELCRSCGRHLGWSFHGASAFYGLVVDALSGA